MLSASILRQNVNDGEEGKTARKPGAVEGLRVAQLDKEQAPVWEMYL